MIRITNNKHAGLLPTARRKTPALSWWWLRTVEDHADYRYMDPEITALKVDREPHTNNILNSSTTACVGGYTGDGCRQIPKRQPHS